MTELSTPGVVEPFESRLFVHMADIDGGTIFAHGIVVCPRHLQDHNQALAEIDRIFRAVVQADPEEWNYDDLFTALNQEGFTHFCPAYWIENGI